LNTTENKTCHHSKLATAAHVAVGAVVGGAIVAAVDQGELVKALPSFWHALNVMVSTNARKALGQYDDGLERVMKCFIKVKGGLLRWSAISLGLLLLGVGLAADDGWGGGRVMIGASMLSLSALAFVITAMSDVLVDFTLSGWTFAVDGLRETVAIGAAIVGKETTGPSEAERVERKVQAEKIRTRIKLILPSMLMVNLGIMVTMAFPSWTTLGCVVCVLGVISAILLGLIYVDAPMAAAVKVITKVLIVLVVIAVIGFIFYQKEVKTRIEGAYDKAKATLTSDDAAKVTTVSPASAPAAKPLPPAEKPAPAKPTASAKPRQKRRASDPDLLKQLDADLAALGD